MPATLRLRLRARARSRFRCPLGSRNLLNEPLGQDTTVLRLQVRCLIRMATSPIGGADSPPWRKKTRRPPLPGGDYRGVEPPNTAPTYASNFQLRTLVPEKVPADC